MKVPEAVIFPFAFDGFITHSIKSIRIGGLFDQVVY